jgi:predicted SAM-dependent methyltransferase
MGTTTKTLIKYRNTLLEYGLIKKIVKQKSVSGGYDHNLYQIVLLDKKNVLHPPVEKLPEEKEEIVSGIVEESPSSNQINPNKIVTDNKKSPKEERIKEELKKLNLDKKSIDKIILNHSLEDIEEKLELLEVKRNVINPAGWLITALQANYLNPESSKEENDEEEKITETEEMESESKIVKLNKLALKKKEKEEKDRLFMEESIKWIEQNLVQRLEM